MMTERLYELVFRYRTTKLWEKMSEQQVFAVQMPDGEYGFVSIMGYDGEFIGINLYVGSGFDSYRRFVNFNRFDYFSDFEEHEALLGQDCIQLSWGDKDDPLPEELTEIRKNARKFKSSLRGSDAYPMLRKYTPSCLPWPVSDEKEQAYMEQVLEAALAINDQNLADQIKELNLKNKTVISMMKKDGIWSLSKRVKLPAPQETVYLRPEVEKINSIGIRKIQKLKKKDIIECEILMMPSPIQETENTAPYCPYILMAIMKKSTHLLEFAPISRDQLQEKPEEMVNGLIDAILKEGVRPSAIYCETERTYQMVEPLTQLLGIPLVKSEFLDELDDCEDQFLDFLASEGSGIVNPDDPDDDEELLNEDDFSDDPDADDLPWDGETMMKMLVQEVLALSDTELKKMPKDVKDALKGLVLSGALPAELEKQLRRKLGMK